MSQSFQCIKHINPDEQTTWQGRKFITFDIDWANDEVLNNCINIVEKQNIHATWFITHNTPVISRLRENPLFELGIHPNFNNLLNGNTSNGHSAEEIIDRLLKLVPEAVSVRSHSVTQSSGLHNLFQSKGLKYESNDFIPCYEEIPLKPWRVWNNLIKVPYFWEDDVAAIHNKMSECHIPLKQPGLQVYDFHPIHIYMNTHHMDLYDKTREFHKAPEQLIKYKNKKQTGAEDILSYLIRNK